VAHAHGDLRGLEVVEDERDNGLLGVVAGVVDGVVLEQVCRDFEKLIDVLRWSIVVPSSSTRYRRVSTLMTLSWWSYALGIGSLHLFW
jgi:hypothetical protein